LTPREWRVVYHGLTARDEVLSVVEQLFSTALGFDKDSFIGRNIWNRRYPVVDVERGIVLSIARFGLKAGMESQSSATANDRLVAEFFAVKSGWIQEIHAVLVNRPDDKPTAWPPDYGPGRGGN
jgi:hypothetical protein